MIQASETKKTINFKRVLISGLQLIVIGFLIWYLYQNRQSLIYLNNIKWQHILWVIILDTLSFIVSSFINFSMIRRLDTRVSFLDTLMLQYVNSLLNKVLPTIGGGAVFRAYYLKKRYQFPFTQFASTITGLYVISFSTTSLIGILCLLAIFQEFRVFNWLIFLAFVGILVPTTLIIFFTPKIPTSNHRLLRVLNNSIDSWNIIKKEPGLVFGYMALTVLLLLLSTAYTYLGYQSLGVQPSFVTMLYLSTLGIIMAFLNFTPDGIGIKEAIYVFSQNLVQIPQDILILGSLYLRGVSIISTFLFGGISYWILLRRLKVAGINEIDFQDHK